LAQGFDDLVGDLELEDSQQLLEAIAHDDEFIEHTKAPDLQIKTVCTAKLKWPPSDGEHRLKCGGMVLVVRVKAGGLGLGAGAGTGDRDRVRFDRDLVW
jgi:hypothetical protein